MNDTAGDMKGELAPYQAYREMTSVEKLDYIIDKGISVTFGMQYIGADTYKTTIALTRGKPSGFGTHADLLLRCDDAEDGINRAYAIAVAGDWR